MKVAPTKKKKSPAAKHKASLRKSHKADGSTVESKVLRVLYEYWIVTTTFPPLSYVAEKCAYSPSTTTFKNAIKTLKANKFTVKQGKDTLSLTEEGKAEAARLNPEMQAPTTNALAHARLGKLLQWNDKQRKMWELLLDRHPHSRNELADHAGYSLTTTTFKQTIIKLKAFGYVSESGGMLQLTELAFPCKT